MWQPGCLRLAGPSQWVKVDPFLCPAPIVIRWMWASQEGSEEWTTKAAGLRRGQPRLQASRTPSSWGGKWSFARSWAALYSAHRAETRSWWFTFRKCFLQGFLSVNSHRAVFFKPFPLHPRIQWEGAGWDNDRQGLGWGQEGKWGDTHSWEQVYFLLL